MQTFTRELLFSGLLVLTSLCSYSQDNFQPGELVTSEGQVLKGLIEFDPLSIEPNSLRFRESASSPIEEFLPKQVTSFELEDKVYLSETAQFPSEDPAMYTEDNKEPTYAQSIFVQVIVKGSKSLFLYEASPEESIFFIGESGNLELLGQYSYSISNAGFVMQTATNEYIRQLKIYFTECIVIARDLEKTEYSRKGLVRAFERYNNCIGEKPELVYKTAPRPRSFGVILAGDVATMNFTGDETNPLVKTQRLTSSSSSIGFHWAGKLSKNKDNLWLVNNLIVQPLRASGEYSQNVGETSQSRIATQISLIQGQFSHEIRQNFQLDKVALFAGAGISWGINRSLKYTRKVYYSVGNNAHASTTYVYGNGRGITTGLVASAGIDLKRFAIEGRYQITNNVIHERNLSSYLQRISVRLVYIFNRR